MLRASKYKNAKSFIIGLKMCFDNENKFTSNLVYIKNNIFQPNNTIYYNDLNK